jgi:hypothetical protein
MLRRLSLMLTRRERSTLSTAPSSAAAAATGAARDERRRERTSTGDAIDAHSRTTLTDHRRHTPSAPCREMLLVLLLIMTRRDRCRANKQRDLQQLRDSQSCGREKTWGKLIDTTSYRERDLRSR